MLNKETWEFLASKKNEFESKKNRPFGALWSMSFFMHDREILPLKIFSKNIDTLIGSLTNNTSKFISLETATCKTIINTDKILYVLISEEEIA